MQELSQFPGIEKDVLMSLHTTYKIGGPAKYFFVAKTPEDVVSVLKAAKDAGVAPLILGGGSNLLVSDQGFDGLVVKIEIAGIEKMPENPMAIRVGAGVSMADVVSYTLEQSLEGLEWAGGLPGTFGGAVRGNAGAFGGEMKDSVIEVTAVKDDLTVVLFKNDECQFAYRSSIFKEKGWTILSAVVQLKPGDKKALEDIAQSRMNYRKERHPLEYPNSGSVFKNTPVEAFIEEHHGKIKDVIKKDPFEVVPTAFIVSELGLKGTRIGNAQISEKHPNFLVNLGGAKADDIVGLIRLIKAKVKDAYGVDLEVEVQLVPPEIIDKGTCS